MNSKKVTDLKSAISEVKDGMTVFVDGFGYNRTPMACVHEIIKRQVQDLRTLGSIEIQADMLIGAGCVSMLDNGWTGAEGWPHGSFSSYPMRRKIEEGKLQVEYYSNLAIAWRLIGAAYGWSFVSFPGFQSSDHFRLRGYHGENKVKMIKCPFTGEDVPVLSTLSLDVAIIHAQKADVDGNAMITGPLGYARSSAFAAKTTIVTCEEVVPVEYTRQHMHEVVIPGAFVKHVVEVPFGAYPTACQGYYDYDWDWIKYYFEQSKEESTFNAYLDEYVFGCNTWEDFLNKVLTQEKRNEIKASSVLLY